MAYENIIGFEGFRPTPYWDVNAYRIGYGSDTVTLPDGTVRRVTQGMRVSEADARRDFERRINTEFVPGIINAIGQDAWNRMTQAQRESLASIAYNYGSLPNSVVAAVRSGNPQQIGQAIQGLGGHNNGINRNRRNQEAQAFLGGGQTVASTDPNKPSTDLNKGAAGAPLTAPQPTDMAARFPQLAQRFPQVAGVLDRIAARRAAGPLGAMRGTEGRIIDGQTPVLDRVRARIATLGLQPSAPRPQAPTGAQAPASKGAGKPTGSLTAKSAPPPSSSSGSSSTKGVGVVPQGLLPEIGDEQLHIRTDPYAEIAGQKAVSYTKAAAPQPGAQAHLASQPNAQVKPVADDPFEFFSPQVSMPKPQMMKGK